MISRLFKTIVLGLLVGCVLISVPGCSNFKADIPHHVITEAVALQAEREQNDLWQRLSSTSDGAPKLSINKVKVREVRRVKVSSDLAYEVVGTFQYKLRYPNLPTVRQSQVPFTVILQDNAASGDWQLLQRGSGLSRDRTWHWEPLRANRDSAAVKTAQK